MSSFHVLEEAGRQAANTGTILESSTPDIDKLQHPDMLKLVCRELRVRALFCRLHHWRRHTLCHGRRYKRGEI